MFIKFKKFHLKNRIAYNFVSNTSLKSQLLKLFSILTVILAIHITAMIELENLSVSDALWLTMTSATTVGYGDLSAQTTGGRIATIILLYVGGIAILAQVAALYFEYRQEIKDRKLRGDWSWDMEDHIVFLNCPEILDKAKEEYFYQAISGLRKSNSEVAQLPIIIVSDQFNNGIPDRLHKLDVVFVNKPLSNQETLESANVKEAHTIVVLSKNEWDTDSDSINFDLVDRLKEFNIKGRVIVEAIQDNNRSRLKKIGANNVLRPIRAYPELLMRAIIAPGSEQVIETLFDSYGEECIKYEISAQCSWLEVIEKFTSNDLGIPIAYEAQDGTIVNSPSSKKKVNSKAVFVIVNDGDVKTNAELQQLFTAA